MAERILVIEDDRRIRDLLRRGLIFEGYTVDTAEDGEAGLHVARERTPDELRAKDDFEPLTEEQYAQFDRLFGSKNATPAAKGTAA